MRHTIKFVLAGVAAVLFGASVSASSSVSLGDMAALQATMQQYVDRKSVDGAYLFFDTDKAEVRELYPANAHPMILQMGKHFVLCFDFVDSAGARVEVDYYIARKDAGFVVFQESIGNRGLVQSMMQGGRVTPVR